VRKSAKTKDSQRAWNDEHAHCSRGSNRSEGEDFKRDKDSVIQKFGAFWPSPTFEAPHCKQMALLWAFKVKQWVVMRLRASHVD